MGRQDIRTRFEELRRRRRGEGDGTPEAASDKNAGEAGALAPPRPIEAWTSAVGSTTGFERIGALEAIRAKAPNLEATFARLNDDQLAAAAAGLGDVLVLARVGSGKTTVLVHRALHAVTVLGTAPTDIVLVTFTKKAAGEIRERLDDFVRRHGVDVGGIRVGTIHATAARCLRDELPIERMGLPKNFRVIDEGEAIERLNALVEELGFSVRYKKKLGRRLEAFRDGRTIYGAMKRADDFAALHAAHEAAKRRDGVVEFDDLIRLGAALAKEAPPARPPSLVLIDEFQDTDEKQLEFLLALGGRETRYFAVGDPHQMVYSWRGSTPKIFDEFKRRRRPVLMSLPINYRSTSTILRCAAAVLGVNSESLRGTAEEGRPIEVAAVHDAQAEATMLAGRIGELRRAGTPLEEIAVLFRLREETRPLAEALRRAGIPCAAAAPRLLREFPAAVLAADLVRAAAEPAAANLARVLVRDDFAVLDRRTLGAAARRAAKNGTALEKELAAIAREKGKRRLDAALETIAAVRRAGPLLADASSGEGRAPGRIAEELFATLELDRRLGAASSQYRERTEAARRVLELIATGAAPAAALCRPFDQGPSERGVSLLTFHASKGLEFEAVFIVGVNEGVVPLRSGRSSWAEEAEEIRLFFVAMTRAKKRLELTWRKNPWHHGAKPEPSGVLMHLPKALVVRSDGAFTAALRPTAAADPFAPGQRVRHPRYGAGVVVRADAATVVCRFFDQEERSFARAFSGLSAEAAEAEGGS